MDKDINTFAMRVREWYSWHFPELKDIVKDNFLFAKCASYIKVRTYVLTIVLIFVRAHIHAKCACFVDTYLQSHFTFIFSV